MRGFILVALCALGTPAWGATSPLQPRWHSSERFGETHTFIADLRDETYLQLQLGLSNIGVGDRRGACRILVVQPGQPTVNVSKVVDEDEWAFAPGKESSLTIGACSVRIAGDVTRVVASVESTRVELIIGAAMQLRRPPLARVVAPDDADSFYESDVSIPFADVQATLSIAGATRRAMGRAYADHSRITMSPADVARGWVRLRALDPECGLLLLLRIAPDGKATGWRWKVGDAAPQKLIPGRLSFPAPDAKRQKVAMDLDSAQVQLHPVKSLYRFAPMEERGFMGRLVGSWVGNPITITYRAAVMGYPECPDLLGIMELTHVEP